MCSKVRYGIPGLGALEKGSDALAETSRWPVQQLGELPKARQPSQKSKVPVPVVPVTRRRPPPPREEDREWWNWEPKARESLPCVRDATLVKDETEPATIAPVVVPERSRRPPAAAASTASSAALPRRRKTAIKQLPPIGRGRDYEPPHPAFQIASHDPTSTRDASSSPRKRAEAYKAARNRRQLRVRILQNQI